jgi:hypothetical protein
VSNNQTKSDKSQLEPMQPETLNADEPSCLPEGAEAHIAVGLKRLYGQMLSEPMPDKFAGLLQQLAKADREPEGPK